MGSTTSMFCGPINSLGWKRTFMPLLFFGLFIFILTILPIPNLQITCNDANTAEQLTRALAELEALRRQYKLCNIINKSGLKAEEKEALENSQMRSAKANKTLSHSPDLGYTCQKEEPNQQYEVTRRRTRSNIQEFWSFMHSEIVKLQTKLQNLGPGIVVNFDYILNLGAQHKRSLLHDMETLSEVDGFATWREQEIKALSNLVQSRLRYLQNPKDCNKARKLMCRLNKNCGYGCQLHHVVYCLMVAYATERTLILDSEDWRYTRGGWDDVFKPISDTCTSTTGASVQNWPGSPDSQEVYLPKSLWPRPSFLPLALPKDLSQRLVRIHGDPVVWWVGQFFKYLLRPQETTANFIQEAITNMGFKRPIVGVHVRRTDKIKEALFYDIEEYMAPVEEYYNQLELKENVTRRRIYLACDDPKVIVDAKEKYPQYEILGDPNIAKTAALSTRYSPSSLNGIILDVHILSMCDYLVCTLSSNIGRMSYEIMQNYFPDAAGKFKSLDDIYHYDFRRLYHLTAMLPHESQRPDEMNLQVGDLVAVKNNLWNGFSKGRNLRTQQVGLYPNFKVKNIVEISKFPTYMNATQNDKGWRVARN